MTKLEMKSRLGEWISEQRLQEYAPATLERYRQSVEKFLAWCRFEKIDKDLMLNYKEWLTAVSDHPASINTWIVCLNKYLKWLGHPDLTLKKIKTQMQQSNEEVISISDYKRLLRHHEGSGIYRHQGLRAEVLHGRGSEEQLHLSKEQRKGQTDHLEAGSEARAEEIRSGEPDPIRVSFPESDSSGEDDLEVDDLEENAKVCRTGQSKKEQGASSQLQAFIRSGVS